MLPALKRNIFVLFAVGSLLIAPAKAQKLSVGVVGGASVTDAFSASLVPSSFPGNLPGTPVGSVSYSQSKDWVLGAMIEWRLTSSWSLEADGLFRTLHMTRASLLADGTLGSAGPAPVITWEFPILAKYRLLPSARARPFIEGGPSFRTAGNLNGTNPSHFGMSAGVGVEAHWLGLDFAPTLRYTRWAWDDPNRSFGSPSTRPDQLELLLSVSRQSESHWQPLGGRLRLGVVAGTNLSADYCSETQQLNTEQIGPLGAGHAVSLTISGPKSFLVGPSIEFLLPRRISVETDVIYRPVSATNTISYDTGARVRSDSRFVTWEFPVLAKYRLGYRRFAPFVGVGPNFRLTQSLTSSSPYGVMAAAGIEFRVGSAKISPSVRYIHWGRDTGSATGAIPTQNQAVFLLGLSF
jgi:hypothetical protein